MNNPVLSMLGLALRGGRLAVGEEPVEAVVRARDARVLLVASDAADNTYRRVKHFAEIGQCIWLRIPYTKAELGQAVGRNATAIVAVTDVGLAAAIVHRLADTDPERYAEAAERLDLKAKRAAERQAEQRAHEKQGAHRVLGLKIVSHGGGKVRHHAVKVSDDVPVLKLLLQNI